MGPIRLSLLGPPAVAHEGVTTPFLNERRFQLLAYLAFSGEWVERDRLAALLWPEHDAAAARRNLRKIVFRARESSWAAGLQTQGERLRWAVPTDLDEFRQALAAGRLADACAQYKGPLLQGLDDAGNSGFSAWLNAHRAGLHLQWRDAALKVLPTLGTADARAAAARRLVDDDPFDEHGLLAALAVLGADGRRAEAQGLHRNYVRRLAEELGVEPSAAVRAAGHAVVEPPRPAEAGAPAPADLRTVARDAFVGRRAERRELLAMLQRPPCRVITILGPGGIGKSRFAREQLADLAALVQADVHWVALQDVATASQLFARIAQVLGARVNDASDPVAQLVAQHGQHPALLVLDNAEHLPGLAAWLQPLLAAWPLLRLVLTSRARVGLEGEWLLPLSGLAVPDADSRDLDAAAAFDAVRLFELRARRAQPGFELAAHLDAVIALVERVDGLPLAIEMAADWVRLLPPSEIVRELAQSIDILQRDAEGDADAQGHGSMQAVFRRSWDLLAPRERQALTGVTVFRGGFRRDAAAAVVGASWPVLASLVDRSLLTLDAQGRFGMHPLVATWAATADPGSAAGALALRHAEFFAGWLDAAGRAAAADARPLIQAIEVEFANCERAWHAAVAAERPDLLVAMRPALLQYTETQGRWRDACALFAAALASDGVLRTWPGLRPELLANLSSLHYRLGEIDRSEAMARASLALVRSPAALNPLGLALLDRGQPEAALPLLMESIELARASGDRRRMGNALINAAIALKNLGRRDECVALNEQALAVQREIGNDDGVLMVLNNLGDTLRIGGELERAREYLEAGLRLAEERGMLPRLQNLRLTMGHLLIKAGQGDAARTLLETVVLDARHSGQLHAELRALMHLARLALEEQRSAAFLQGCREVFARTRARGFQALALDALVLHADWHAAHGDAGYAQLLRAWLALQSGLVGEQREYVRAQLAAGAPVTPAAGFDIAAAGARLAAPHPGTGV